MICVIFIKDINIAVMAMMIGKIISSDIYVQVVITTWAFHRKVRIVLSFFFASLGVRRQSRDVIGS